MTVAKGKPGRVAIVEHDAEVRALVRLKIEITLEQAANLCRRFARIDVRGRFRGIANRPFHQAVVVDRAVSANNTGSAP